MSAIRNFVKLKQTFRELRNNIFHEILFRGIWPTSLVWSLVEKMLKITARPLWKFWTFCSIGYVVAISDV
jgi:hypothetical protein